MPVNRPLSSPPPAERSRGALERMFVWGVISTALLVLAMVAVVAYTRGVSRRQADTLDDLTRRVAALEKTVHGERAPAYAPAETSPGAEPFSRPVEPAGKTPRETGQPPAPVKPAPATEPALPAPADALLQQRLDAVVSREPSSPADMQDPKAAEALLDQAVSEAGHAAWSPAAWARLAVLARLLGRDAVAETFAKRAAAGGDPLLQYTEISVRALLACGRNQEALALARTLRGQTGGAPAATVLLAAALVASGQPGPADELLAHVEGLAGLDTRDLLLLARLLTTLEHWDALAAVLAEIGEIPGELAQEYDFLTAVSLAHSRRAVEALAAFDYLAAHPPLAESPPPARPAWPRPAPTRYEVEVWRGVSLMYASRPDAAREVLLKAAQLQPGRADAPYYLGLLEDRLQQHAQARVHLQNAVTCDPHLAPAYEALAKLALDAGDMEFALDQLNKAIQTNPHRASAYFLLALVRARLSQRDAAAAALQTAFRLDERYLGEAQQADVLLRLFTSRELDDLARPTPVTAPAASEPAAGSDNAPP